VATRDDFPAPVLPTIPTFPDECILNFNHCKSKIKIGIKYYIYYIYYSIYTIYIYSVY
jgi:hypothetical protein